MDFIKEDYNSKKVVPSSTAPLRQQLMNNLKPLPHAP